MHNAHTAEQYHSMGHLFIKRGSYKSKKRNDQFEFYINKNTERIVNIRKIHMQHWLFKEIASEFKVNCLNTWDAHPINITNLLSVRRNYTTLAECTKGPIIVEHRNTVATQFSIDCNYPETIQINPSNWGSSSIIYK